MTTFKITFGQMYRREPHPTLGLWPELPDGWLTIDAEDEMEAREKINDLIGNVYAFLYLPDHSLTKYHPAGNLGSLEEAVAARKVWCVGMPVWVDREARVFVDMSELEVALAEVDAPVAVGFAATGPLGEDKVAMVVFFDKDMAAWPRCPNCGAPVEEFRSPEPDGDSTSHAQCVNRRCPYTY